jgi:polyisoprenyl-teichoic acid--peptidoglycan teichoic acid transferase
MKPLIIKIISVSIVVLIICALSYVSFFAWKIHSTGRKITLAPITQNDNLLQTLKSFVSPKKTAVLKGEENGRINILLLGIAGQGKAGTNLTDTLMIASINTQTNQVALMSLPRDFYVKTSDSAQMKINSVLQYGLNKYNKDTAKAVGILKDVLADITSLPINYYLILNFDGFEKAIDLIGRINVMNERDIYDSRYPGPNFSYETFKLDKGFQRLDGATALKYARERHDDPEGDFGRAKRQQQVMQAAKNKIFSTGTLFNFFALNNLLNNLGDNIKTDISTEEMESFFELSKKLDMNNINNVVIDAWNHDSLLKVSHVFYGDLRAFVLVPRVGNFSEIQELAKNVFDLNKIVRRKEEIAKENASVVIINKSEYPSLVYKIKQLLSDNFGYKNVIIVSDNQKYEEKTVAYDLTGGTKPFTLDELVKKLPSVASYSLPDNYKNTVKNISADIVIVLGKDIVSRYNMEEDSVEDYKKSGDNNEYLDITGNN